MSSPIKVNLTEFEWDAIVHGIREEQCVIFIGSEFYRALDSEHSQTEKLSQYLHQHQDELNIRVQENAWFHLRNGGFDGAAYSAIRRFYQDVPSEVQNLLEKVTQVNFHLYLSLTPDYHLRDTFKKQSLPHRFESYVRNEPNRNTDLPTSELPLVYNLVGELNNRNSLVLTFDDFYDYLESTFKGNSMSSLLQNNIFEAQYFLFLGVPFDQWFVHLFMRILRQHQERKTKFATGVFKNVSDSEICSEQYHIKFVNSAIPDFINELHQRCEAQSLLRNIKSEEGNNAHAEVFNNLMDWAGNNEFQRIVDFLKNLLRGAGEVGRSFLITVIQLGGRFRNLEEQQQLGILSVDDSMQQMNVLRKDFLTLIQKLQGSWQSLNISL